MGERRIIEAADEARRRIERELHDTVQQRLVALALNVRAAQANLPAGCPDLDMRLSRIADGLGDTMDDLREILRGVYPAILADGGLEPALKMLARRCPVPVELHVTVGGRLELPVEAAAYYVVEEALSNTAEHAFASRARVEALVSGDGWLRVSVCDDGVGGADPGRGSGLRGLEDRVHALDGKIGIHHPWGGGTVIEVHLPVDRNVTSRGQRVDTERLKP
ncbi:sensor histidine kinase [Actinoplanes sp. CA-054009]